ncbi:MAG: hypothetical protein K8J31_13275 [Anaerolineae bacterium]|nr:hypothetical protein [Anaerolineae bacterium]
MDLDIRVIQHKEFLKTTPNGQIDLSTSKRVLLKLASLNKPPSNRDVLLDLRDTTNRLTILDVTELVELMIKHRDSFRKKLAIITEIGTPHQLTAFMETYAINRGFQVAAFDNFEAAILWLATTIDVKLEGG